MKLKPIILFIIGTRPEAIKLVPLILEFNRKKIYDVKVCTSGQHTEMLTQVLDLFSIKADYSLIISRERNTLTEISEQLLRNIDPVIESLKPKYVIVHGDTSTTFAGALAAFYNKCEIVHIEAGLRTGNIYSPWPEEINRRLTAQLARIHFAPTDIAAENLKGEGINNNSIFVVGNTVIDTLLLSEEKIKKDKTLSNSIKSQFQSIDFNKKIILITAHRRENFGDALVNICNAICRLSIYFPEVEFVFPVHLNPIIRLPVEAKLIDLPNVHLLEPQTYLNFVFLMMKAHIILTDSGGIQEEAPSLGCPVLLMRDTTERPEAVAAGTVKLVGSSEQNIYDSVLALFDNEVELNKMSSRVNPFGNGNTSKKIVQILTKIYDDEK